MNPVARTTFWVGLGLALAATALALMLWLLFGAVQSGIDIRVNGQALAWPEWQHWREWPAAKGVGAALLGALLLAVAVPVILLTALALGGAVGIAGVLLAVSLVALLVLSPLWLPLLLAWLMLRRRRPAPALQA